MATFDTIHAEAHSRGNIPKAIKSLSFLARRSEVEPPESLFLADGELVDLIAEGFTYGGYVTTDGFSFDREDSNSEVSAHGEMSPVREDLQSVERTVGVTFLESRKRIIQELADGADYSGVEVGEHELVKHKAEAPMHDDWCLVVIAIDGPAGNEHLMGKVFPTVKVSSVGGEQWGGDDAISREFTFRVFRDDELGVPEIEIEGGAKFLARAESMGWTVPTAG
ncbi:hypothetical protein [Nesterenkonia suensis]